MVSLSNSVGQWSVAEAPHPGRRQPDVRHSTADVCHRVVEVGVIEFQRFVREFLWFFSCAQSSRKRREK